MDVISKNLGTELPFDPELHFLKYTPKAHKQNGEKKVATPCSLQCYPQKPKSENNPPTEEQMSG